MGDSVFQNVEMAPPIEVFQLSRLYNECTVENKVNLGVGAYRTDEGKPWVLPVVSEAEKQMAADQTLNHEYLPVAGMPDFRVSATKLLLGSNHPAITGNRTESFQCLGGTGALRLAAAFLHNVLKFDICYVSNPTWGNHKGIFKAVGFKELREYRYWDAANRELDFNGMIEDLNNAPENAVVILHAVAHNPTGVDPTKQQWEKICQTCIDKKLFVIMDNAYQGFATGDLDEDGFAARLFSEKNMDLLIAQSFSKNFGLYNERTGNLVVVTKDPKKLPEIRSQCEIQIRVMWSNPPNHGARIVATVLNNKAFYDQWRDNVTTMSSRIKKMRQELFDQLKNLSTPGNWSHITKQIGMFSYTGLNAKQVEMMKNEHHVFLLGSGRISMAGVTSKNVAHVAKAIDAAVRAYPTLHMASRAGEEGVVLPTIDFVEFAKKKLRKSLVQHLIQTKVTITGDLVFLDDESDGHNAVPEPEISEESFFKVRMEVKSVSSLNMPHHDQQHVLEPPVDDDVHSHKSEREHISSRHTLAQSGADVADGTKSCFSRESIRGSDPNSNISYIKSKNTFKNHTTQTEDDVAEHKPLAIPAVFEGTMSTPVSFNGMMLTASDLDKLLRQACGADSVPVKFQGAMMTTHAGAHESANIMINPAKFMYDHGKTSKAQGDPNLDASVRLNGQLEGITNKRNMPVVFEGKLLSNNMDG